MANYDILKTSVSDVIKTNGKKKITGALLQQTLLSMINSLGSGYQFVGVATPKTNPGTPDAKVFYIANGKGTYTNFGELEVTDDDGLVILTYDNEWVKNNVSISTKGGLAEMMIPTTYLQLRNMRDNSTLIPGMQYRITDYACTTIQENTQSAGHPFDIIVIADSENTLNEKARAIQHEGDTYFADCKLSAWKIWYCLDNDATRFAWADSANGKGVIYWMKDEWGNECPYDFKNIMFKRYLDEEAECYKYDVSQANNKWCYTFCMVDFIDGESHDVSVEQNKYKFFDSKYHKTYQNKLEPFFQLSDKLNQALNDVVFVTDTNLSYIAQDYSSGLFAGFSQNTFGKGCTNNTLGNLCLNNTFGDRCSYNTFGYDCANNTFGNDCTNNTFGNDCTNNTFGNDCTNNTFGNDCTNNTFGNDCTNNTFGNRCTRNFFDNSCESNIFGEGCQENTFGNGCTNNTFGNDCIYNIIGNNCIRISLVDNCNNNTFGNSCMNVRFIKSYFNYVYLEQGVSWVDVTCSFTTSNSNRAKNIHINAGVEGTVSNQKVCTLTSVNNAYLTTFGSADDTKINV